jgi:hypothetical protein
VVASQLSLLLQRADFLDHLPFESVPEFKQVQLYKKSYMQLVPGFLVGDEIWCPRPSDARRMTKSGMQTSQKEGKERKEDEGI